MSDVLKEFTTEEEAVTYAFEIVQEEMNKFVEKLNLHTVVEKGGYTAYSRNFVDKDTAKTYCIVARINKDNNGGKSILILDPNTQQVFIEVYYCLGRFIYVYPREDIEETDFNCNYSTDCKDYFSKLELMYLYYALKARFEDCTGKDCGYLNCSLHKSERLSLIGECISQWKQRCKTAIKDSVSVSWVCEAVDDYVCVVYTDDCTMLDEQGLAETNAIVITSNTYTDEDNVDRYCDNYLENREDYRMDMKEDLHLLHTMIYEELTSHSDENKDKRDECMNKTDCEQGTVKHYEFDKKLFVPGDVYLIVHSSSDTYYLSIFEMFDEDNRALFVSPRHYDYIMVDNIINGNVRIEKIIDSHDFLKNNRRRSPRLWGLKEAYTFEDTVFKISAVYLITDRVCDFNPYFGVLRNKVLNPKDEAPYLEFMCAVSGDPVKIDIDEFISGRYSIKLVSTIEDFEDK